MYKLSTFDQINLINNVEEDIIINKIVVCDLLSHVIAKASSNDILITVLTNMNVLGVANLSELSAIIFSYDVEVPLEVIQKADDLGIPLYRTNLSSADVSYILYKEIIHA